MRKQKKEWGPILKTGLKKKRATNLVGCNSLEFILWHCLGPCRKLTIRWIYIYIYIPFSTLPTHISNFRNPHSTIPTHILNSRNPHLKNSDRTKKTHRNPVCMWFMTDITCRNQETLTLKSKLVCLSKAELQPPISSICGHWAFLSFTLIMVMRDNPQKEKKIKN